MIETIPPFKLTDIEKLKSIKHLLPSTFKDAARQAYEIKGNNVCLYHIDTAFQSIFEIQDGDLVYCKKGCKVKVHGDWVNFNEFESPV